MKRIVDGLTYNTNTSALIARSEWTNNDQSSPYFGCECEGELYQTRGGAFFLVITTRIPEHDDEEARAKVEFDRLTQKAAERWTLEGDVEIFSDVFSEPPEAAAEEEASATIYIRVPSALKRDVDAAAAKASMSVNQWAMRCVEECLNKARSG